MQHKPRRSWKKGFPAHPASTDTAQAWCFCDLHSYQHLSIASLHVLHSALQPSEIQGFYPSHQERFGNELQSYSDLLPQQQLLLETVTLAWADWIKGNKVGNGKAQSQAWLVHWQVYFLSLLSSAASFHKGTVQLGWLSSLLQSQVLLLLTSKLLFSPLNYEANVHRK